ncbi:TPA: hypothetical protein ACHHIW_002721 [Staphylococcus aureus]
MNENDKEKEVFKVDGPIEFEEDIDSIIKQIENAYSRDETNE